MYKKSLKNQKNKVKLKNKIRFQTMFRFLLILIIGQSMANSMKFSEYVDNGRIERVESVIYELLNIINIQTTDIQVSLKKDIEEMKHYQILINKLIEQLE